MRPEILYPLFKSVNALPGIGPKLADHLKRLCGEHVKDILYHLPNNMIDRRLIPRLSAIQDKQYGSVKVRVIKHVKSRSKSQPYRVVTQDESGELTIVFFRARADYIEKQLPIDSERIISGQFEYYNKSLQMTHPDYILKPDQANQIDRLEPVYPLTAGLSSKTILKALDGAMKLIPQMPEWLDEKYVKQERWSNWQTALTACHNPTQWAHLKPSDPNRMRLAYDELLANQLAISLIQTANKKKRSKKLKPPGDLTKKLLKKLPYKLTQAQLDTLTDIKNDFASDYRMLRLLQGDVGSGKTIVALFAAIQMVESGAQAAIMAPTEILAQQHMQTITELLDGLPVTVSLLTGRDKGKNRTIKLAAIADGSAQIVIGTHALFQADVAFKNLGLCVIDEQHRFGVHQRLLLSDKGSQTDVLVMTATPIPRTLTLTQYGHMECSRLTDKPPGRKPIKTSVVPLDRQAEIIDGIKRIIADKQQVFWVCPLVEESHVIDLAAAEDRYRELKQIFGNRIGLVHGKQKNQDKDRVMEQFATGNLDILVATTVVEVGVNVPNASVMVIEHAERFGLSQLHQLRGRIGRGDKPATCILLYKAPLSETAKQRLNIMRQTEDGFLIAEEDLRLRGTGDILGTRQSGLPDFKVADLDYHKDLLNVANQDAKLILNQDPGLDSPRGKALRALLYLTEKDTAVTYLRSG